MDNEKLLSYYNIRNRSKYQKLENLPNYELRNLLACALRDFDVKKKTLLRIIEAVFNILIEEGIFQEE